MNASLIEQLVLLVTLGAVVAILARRLSLPYTVGLVLAGIAMAVMNLRLEIVFSRDFVFNVLLPPLVFEAAMSIDWRALRRDLLLVSVLAVFGVMLSAAVTSAMMHFAVGWIWPEAAVFGILIAATDPVS